MALGMVNCPALAGAVQENLAPTPGPERAVADDPEIVIKPFGEPPLHLTVKSCERLIGPEGFCVHVKGEGTETDV